MIKETTTIISKARAARPRVRQLTKMAGLSCEVFMSRGERRINAKSIMGVMMLAAGLGSVVDHRDRRPAGARGHGRAAGADRRQVRRRPVTPEQRA